LEEIRGEQREFWWAAGYSNSDALIQRLLRSSLTSKSLDRLKVLEIQYATI